jgi:hypothetical protein
MRFYKLIPACVLMLLASCGGASDTATSILEVDATQTTTQNSGLPLGSTGPGGGIVFYDAGSVQAWGRYLEAAPQDLPGEYNWQDAMSAAMGYDGGGFNDWRLPTIEEWEFLYQEEQMIGGFSIANYWSSTEIDDEFSWYWNFTAGTSASDGWKPFSSEIYVRPVRAFD